MDRFERAGKAFETLCRTMATLRAPGGCEWDQAQTLESLQKYLLEETYETLDAIENEDPAQHCEELGDLLLQIVFQAEITQQSSFDIEAVARGINDKLIRRHPHIFDPAKRGTPPPSWEVIKAQERAGKPERGLLDGLPHSLPALVGAFRVGEKAAGVGFDWKTPSGAREKFSEEWTEFDETLTNNEPQKRREEEFGDLLFSLVNYARHLDIDPEKALKGTIKKFRQRFRYIELTLQKKGHSMHQQSIDRLNELWDDAKAKIASRG